MLAGLSVSRALFGWIERSSSSQPKRPRGAQRVPVDKSRHDRRSALSPVYEPRRYRRRHRRIHEKFRKWRSAKSRLQNLARSLQAQRRKPRAAEHMKPIREIATNDALLGSNREHHDKSVAGPNVTCFQSLP